VNSTNQIINPSRSKPSSDKRVPRLFWKFGAEFHGNEAIRHDATDFLIFSLIGVLCLWPIVSVAMTIARVLG
jgi:hypothetical protein